jgi:hypothetical protein
LFHPWFEHNRDAIRWIEPCFDPERLMPEVRERLTSDGYWQSLARGELDYPAAQQRSASSLPHWLAASTSTPVADQMKELARGTADCRYVRLPPDSGQWHEVIQGLWDTGG